MAAPAGNPWKLERRSQRGEGYGRGGGGLGSQRQAWTKAGVISAVWVTNCWTCGLNGLSGRKTVDKEANKSTWEYYDISRLSNPLALLFFFFFLNQLIDFFFKHF